MNNQDPLLFIAGVDPVDSADLEQFAASPTGVALRDRILASDPSDAPTTQSPFRHRRVVRVAVVTVVAAASVAAAVVLASRPTTNPLTVGCYQTPSQEANTAVIALDPDREDLGPVGACSLAWPSAFGEPAPDHLVACVVTSGGLGVFPTGPGLSPSDACNAIGVAPAGEGDYSGLTGAEVRELNSQLRARHKDLQGVGDGCVGADQLATESESVLNSAGAIEWEVIDGTIESDTWTTPDGRPQPVTAAFAADGSVCADFVFEATQGQILLITDWPTLSDN